MTTDLQTINELYKYTDTDPNLKDPDTAHLVINGNHVLGMHAVPGLNITVKELEDGIDMVMKLDPGTVVEKPVHLCFGMLPKTGVQRIIMDVDIGAGSKISLLAHCVFPKAVDVQHIMDAKLRIGDGAEYNYFEKHVHSPEGGVKVYPKAVVQVGKKAIFKTEFELIKGRVGLIDIDYETSGDSYSVVDMTARISGRKDDIIKIRETGHLNGEYARGVLISKIAVRDQARAEVYNKMTATAAFARGHVDCKEIVQDEGMATAIPIVEVRHPKAHITHEAAIGSVDSKQLETLMSRGLDEDDAVEIIINGLLSRRED
ncbi:MAG: SufBD protein [candidate division Zixibacteria bacterium HGW-Zixibacteria-1]|nr:MAG: SufBD protein [candidate division Zixibacteria bacterium HGW-Zixibacteria-1]